MGKKTKPQAREGGLLVEELQDETLVYDLKRHRAHCLNDTAAFVWRHCDGRTGIGQLAQLLHGEFGVPADEQIVWFALRRLERAHLLHEPVKDQSDLPNISRRQLVKKLGRIGIALPLVVSIVSPTAVQAATLVTPFDCFFNTGPSLGKCCTTRRTCILWRGRWGICFGARC